MFIVVGLVKTNAYHLELILLSRKKTDKKLWRWSTNQIICSKLGGRGDSSWTRCT